MWGQCLNDLYRQAAGLVFKQKQNTLLFKDQSVGLEGGYMVEIEYNIHEYVLICE